MERALEESKIKGELEAEVKRLKEDAGRYGIPLEIESAVASE